MGFDLLEYVKKSNYENTALIAPAGYGKTQFLLKCFEALKNENGVVPCYIDIAALNTKDLYTELQKYFFKDEKSYLGSIEFFKRFYNMVSAESQIKYVLLINHYEDAFNNESIADVTNIIENFVKMGCCVIVSSAFNDGKVFKNFKVLKLEPHSKEKIISILEDKFKDSPKFDFKNLKEQVYSIISTPLMLGWYIELIKTNSANDVMINSEHQLMDRKFNEVLDNDFVLKFAYYCTEHKTKYIAEKELVELLLAHNGKVRLVSRIFGKKHINDFEADVLMLEKYGIAKYEKSSQKLVFSNQICIDYFTAKKIGRDVNNNNFDVFDEFIFSEQICKFLSYEIDKRSLLTELNSMRATQGGNVNRCFESCDDIVKTTNLINTLYFYENSFKACNLNNLDLRLCNFIGKECVNTDFSNSLCNDACFVPLESETPNFFAISEDGKYFATGNKSAVNIWDVKYSTVIYRTLSDESSPFTDIGYKKDTGFVISTNSELYSSVIVKIKNGIISQSLNYDKNIVSSCIKKSKKDSVDKFDSYGTLCCKQENFVLLRSDENSYYGNAYLLFDAENEKLLSVCKVNSHLKISNAVQDGDEIEFLIENDGKPLRSICFNDSTKEIYRKNYPSLIGNLYYFNMNKNDFKFVVNTDNIDCFVNWQLYYLERNIECGKLTNLISKKRIGSKITNSNIILSKKHEFYISPIVIFGNIARYCGTVKLNYSISAKDWFFTGITRRVMNLENFNSLMAIEVDLKYNHANLTTSANVNILERDENLYVLLGNSVYVVTSFNNKHCGELSFVKKIKFQFSKLYLYAIEHFPWIETIKYVIDKYNTSTNYSLGKISRQIVERQILPIIELLESLYFEFVGKNWIFAISSFVEETVELIINCRDNLFMNNKDDFNYNEYLLNNEEYIEGFKNWCFPCDSGISYYNGEKSCYIHLDNKFDIKYKNEYYDGCLLIPYRNQIHYYIPRYYCDITYLIRLYDIHKSDQQNTIDNLIIPIYDLNLYNANIDCILGISAVVKDIIQKQTEIYTKYLTFDD